MSDILALCGFYLVSLLAVYFLFPRLQVNSLAASSSRQVTPIQLGGIIILTVALFAGFATWMFRTRTTETLQMFLLLVFALAWIINIFYLLSIRRLWLRFGVAALASFVLLMLMLLSNSQLAANVFTAGAMLWVGPVLLRRYKLQFRVLNLLFGMLLVFDVWYVAVAQATDGILGQPFFFNGLITFGHQALGAGDILVSYLLINCAQWWRGNVSGLILVFALSVIPLVIFLLLQTSQVVLPFTVFIIPLGWLVFLLRKPNRSSSSNSA